MSDILVLPRGFSCDFLVCYGFSEFYHIGDRTRFPRPSPWFCGISSCVEPCVEAGDFSDKLCSPLVLLPVDEWPDASGGRSRLEKLIRKRRMSFFPDLHAPEMHIKYYTNK